MQSLFETICKIGIFMICARTIVHFRAQETYEKYLKLLVGIMVLIQLFLPVGTMLLGSGGQKGAEALSRLGRELEEGMRQAQEEAAAADALLEEMTLEEVKRRMEEEAREREEETQVQGGETQDQEGGSRLQGVETQAQEGGKRLQEVEGQVQEGRSPLQGGETRERNGEETPGEIRIEIEPVEPIDVQEESKE